VLWGQWDTGGSGTKVSSWRQCHTGGSGTKVSSEGASELENNGPGGAKKKLGVVQNSQGSIWQSAPALLGIASPPSEVRLFNPLLPCPSAFFVPLLLPIISKVSLQSSPSFSSAYFSA